MVCVDIIVHDYCTQYSME